jgi:hypothetical protein
MAWSMWTPVCIKLLCAAALTAPTCDTTLARRVRGLRSSSTRNGLRRSWVDGMVNAGGSRPSRDPDAAIHPFIYIERPQEWTPKFVGRTGNVRAWGFLGEIRGIWTGSPRPRVQPGGICTGTATGIR